MCEKRELQQKSEVYGFLADLFLTPIPTPGTAYVEALLTTLAGLNALTAAEAASLPGLKELRHYQEMSKVCQVETLQRQLAVDRTRLFRGRSAEAAFQPPYEALYRRQRQQPELLLELITCYRQAGLVYEESAAERPDYAGVELAFLSYLYTKEKEAEEQGWTAEAHRYGSAAAAFVQDHLSCWLPAYGQQMAQHAETDFFRGIGLCLVGLLTCCQ